MVVKVESQSRALLPVPFAGARGEWKMVGAENPGFSCVMPAIRAEQQMFTKVRSPRKLILPALSEQLSPQAELPSLANLGRDDGPIFFHTDQAKDAAATDPVAMRVRSAAEAECALCGDAEALETMYQGVEFFVNSSAAERWHLSSKSLGIELVTCLSSRKRRTPLAQLTPQLEKVADSFLSWMPRYVKKPYFLEIVKEEMEKRRIFLDHVKNAPFVSRRHQTKPQAVTEEESAAPSAPLETRVPSASSATSVENEEVDKGSATSPTKTDPPSQRPSVTRPSTMSCVSLKLQNLVEDYLESQTERRETVFHRFSDNYSRMDTHDLVMALRLVRFSNINKAWAQEATLSVTKYFEVSEREFIEFVNQYNERLTAAHEQCFNEFDTENTGYVDKQKLGKLLAAVGIEVMAHVLTQLLIEVDLTSAGCLSYDDFEGICHVISHRHGFTKDEHDDMLNLFEKFASDADTLSARTMPISRVPAIIQWIGFNVGDDAVDQIVGDIDADCSRILDEDEFMACIGRVRDQELQALKDAIKADAGGSFDSFGGFESEAKTVRFLAVFRRLGYVPDMEAVEEARVDTSSSAGADSCALSMMWQLLQMYRTREGLTKQEANEVREMFQKHADRSEVLGLGDVGKVLRSIGYVTSFDAQQTLSAKVDVCNTGFIGEAEMLKLVKLIRNEDVELMKREFNKVKREGRLVIPLSLARQALTSIDCVNPDGSPADILRQDHLNGEMDMFGFCGVAMRKRKEMRALFRENGGFSQDDLQELKNVFNHFDSDGSGDIAKKELVRLIAHLMPDYALDPARNKFIISLITDGDEDGSGSLDFHEFARLVRQIHDFSTMERIYKESKAIEKTGFDTSEVQSFRDIFMSQGEGAKDLPFADVRTILQGICPMGAKQTEELAERCRKVLKVAPDAAEERLTLDFPDFLRLMREVIDTNFAQIRKKFGFNATSFNKGNQPQASRSKSSGASPSREVIESERAA